MDPDPEASIFFAGELVLHMRSICARYEINTTFQEAIILEKWFKPVEWYL